MRSGLGSVSVDSDTERTEGTYTRSVAASPLKAHSYSQLRNVSSPFPQAAQLGNSSPPSPRSTTSPPPLAASSHLEARPMPRTSSIDSAISAIYPGALHSHKPSQESGAEIPDISNLIKAAGSSEILIQHLLKEKQHSAARETQLWRLVDKQRSLVLGLNDDLEKALKDKERYRKKVREHLDKVPPIPTPTPRAPTPQTVATSRSPSPSKASADLPIQGQRSEHALSTDCHETVPTFVPTTDSTGRSAAPLSGPTSKRLERLEDDEWVRSKKRMQGSKHSHKATSSSDVGVLGPINPAPSVAPIQTSSLHNPTETDKLGSQSQTSPALRPVVSPSSSFAAKRSHPQTNKPLNVPNLVLAESTPTNNDFERMTPPRKAPPAPLDLGQQRRDISARSQSGLEEHSQTDYDEDIEVDELPILERGRKKTREDDDREREAASLKEKQDRSRSKKDKTSGSRTTSAKSKAQESRIDSQPQTVPFTPSIKSFSPDTVPIGGSSYLSPPTSLAGVLNPSESLDEYSITERVTLAKPMSPGLPLSPRPNHRPMNPPTPRLPRDGTGPSIASPPISPRDGFIGLPLSPRAPSQPIPLPPHTPASLIDSPPQYMDSNGDDAGSSKETYSPSKSPSDTVQHRIETPLPSRNAESGPKARGVFQGFISEAYPGLLLPPNALPSILVRVVSSRLKPSRHSLVIKGSEEEPVFTLGISARSDRQGLWQVEKPMQSLQQLDQQLRQSSAIAVKHPDRSLFSGHAPAKVDARRIALEKYFETLLDTQMDERTALTLCHYLSTQVSEMDEESDGVTIGQSPGSPTTHGPDGKLFKQGYLTKRGKNFGGWKARYFVLNEPVLRYYETPGGSLLGTIKIHSAQIGKQNKPSHSPTREEADGQFRHAFLIREPKRKDSNNFIDHVLCAESDTERDAWVEALLCYVENARPDINSKPQISKTDSGKVIVLSKNSSKKDMVSSESPDSDGFDSLQAVPYENTQAAQAPLVQIIPDPRPTESPSPTTSGSQPSLRAPSAQSKAISAPQNGIKISDVGAWGNKPIAPPLNHPKEQKKRGIWGFRDRNAADLGTNHSNESNLSLTQQQYQEQITNVKAAFGATLAEAVEFCGPRGIDACLPAVVYRCLEYLEMKDAPSEEGIFRMSGSNTLIKSLRNRFNAEGDLDLLGDDQPYYDVHAVASLLKLYLRELPQPVLTRELHLQFLSVLGKRRHCPSTSLTLLTSMVIRPSR